ncbi:2-amino-4-hydroxy-6-hydroxymethyldihydropteridine diphosphokinase [uncultured Bartonella sp.]|uniref:2-amino-4-hydroxy-6- hydroxymethyldihydropteridine diphosphokinase n=1 Tax=uncultured Bartonella sp. TaxID=104108 RepID=UPI00260843A9|nr:2-amino-4-hydroxy-6-hydroxymethyldihydropteridine diphosphokinase [uncultured Bartonella sp.]
MTKRAWLGLGGNIGNVRLTLEKALRNLDQSPDVSVQHVSSFYQTSPWGKTDQNDFINLCCQISTNLLPEDLLEFCLKIEQKYGRVRTEKWGPRSLDIDLLVYESVDQYRSAKLTLPHPLMTRRAFVLRPLCEIAPDVVVNGRTVSDWNQHCSDHGVVVVATHSTIR